MQCICQKQQIKSKKKRWLRWWKWVKSAAREARGRRVPQPWCSEKERCCDWLSLPSLPRSPHNLSSLHTQSLSLSTHTHTPSFSLALSPSASRSLPRLLPSQLHLRLPATLFCLSHWLSPSGKFGYISYLHITYLSVGFLSALSPHLSGVLFHTSI